MAVALRPHDLVYQAVTFPSLGDAISVAYGAAGHRVRAYTLSAALKLDRYDDSFPPAVSATQTLEASGVTGLVVNAVQSRRGRGGVWFELDYCVSDVAKTRRSRDWGVTWPVAETIASGYQDVVSAIDARTGLKLVLLWKESESRWYSSVGEQADTGEWTYTTPVTAVSSAKRGGDLTLMGGFAEFDYRTTSDVLTTVRARNVRGTGAMTWA